MIVYSHEKNSKSYFSHKREYSREIQTLTVFNNKYSVEKLFIQIF